MEHYVVIPMLRDLLVLSTIATVRKQVDGNLGAMVVSKHDI